MTISNAAIAGMYRANRLKGPHGERAHNLQTMPGQGIRMTNGALPQVADYDEYVRVMTTGPNGNRSNKMNGAKLRRMAVMKRNGCSRVEMRDALGVSNTCVSRWLKDLPPPLSG